VTVTDEVHDARFSAWMTALEARQLADLRLAEVSRALRALSAAYVERRGRLVRGAALDGAGKRAAFALFYGPTHYLLARHIVRTLGAADPPPARVLDLGCGTGVIGAAWALEGDGSTAVTGLDRHPWAIDEARWTYKTLGVVGEARRGDVGRLALRRPPDAVVAGFVLNELDQVSRDAAMAELEGFAARGAAVLVIEPIARMVAPWMDRWARAAAATGARHDEWRLTVDLPDIVLQLAQSSGLDRRELTARSLFWPAGSKR
jgi:2-polyprenyl-3-methyl-5-hydroxy-6-metoxy-1,4-benzoquinol methylase